MKKLFFSLALLLGLSAQAQSQLTSFNTMTNGQVYAFITNRAALSGFVIYGSTNTVTLVFYDSTNFNNTNVVLPATTNLASYMTNWSQTLTNTLGYVYTNSFTGLYSYPVAVAAATNELPRVMTIGIPASTTRTVTVQRLLTQGLLCAAYGGTVTVEADYIQRP